MIANYKCNYVFLPKDRGRDAIAERDESQNAIEDSQVVDVGALTFGAENEARAAIRAEAPNASEGLCTLTAKERQRTPITFEISTSSH